MTLILEEIPATLERLVMVGHRRILPRLTTS